MQTVPEKETLAHIAELFKGFADPTRVHILCLLLTQEELCVTDIAERTEVSQSAISHQLRVLKQNRLVKFRKAGKEVYYSLDDRHVHDILATGLEHLSHK